MRNIHIYMNGWIHQWPTHSKINRSKDNTPKQKTIFKRKMEGTIKYLGKSFCCSCLSSEEDSDLLLGEIFQSWRGDLYHKLFRRGIFLLLKVSGAFRGRSEEDEEDGQEEQSCEEQQGRGVLPERGSRRLGHGGLYLLCSSLCCLTQYSDTIIIMATDKD